jgi:predicted SAM-dependent methyltransferase
MSELACFAFEAIAGCKPSDAQRAVLENVKTPAELQKKLLTANEFCHAARFFRMAHEIAALDRARGSNDIRLVVGAAGTRFDGWLSTNERLLNLLRPETWREWLDENSVKIILAEHVWEHLSESEGIAAAKTCFQFLAPDGRLRLAVPDALKPDPAYHEYCRSYPGHKVFHDYRSLSQVLRAAGFTVHLLEYWDEHGTFHENAWSSSDGHVGRSRRFDGRNKGGSELNYTSLMVDGIKPSITSLMVDAVKGKDRGRRRRR